MAPLEERDIETLDETRALSLLEACNSTIDRLKKALDEQSRQKHLLERRILALRGHRSSLNRIPDDLMLDIFKEAVPENSFALGPILRVCRKWYRLAVNSPSLWTTISINFRSTPHALGVRRGTQYLESAIRYSKEAPLDFGLTLPHEFDMVQKMVTALFNAIDQSDIPEDIRADKIYDWLQKAIDRDLKGPLFFEELIEALSLFMTVLAGSNGQNLLRLRQFKLDHDPTDFNPHRWIKALYHPTPNLKKIDIATNEYDDEYPITPLFTHPAPKLSFILTSATHSIDQLLCPDQSIDFLDFKMYGANKLDYFPSYRLLSNLQHLSITHYPFSDDTDRRFQDIFLPSLETLTLRGRVYGADCIKAPRLETLRLFRRFILGSDPFFGPYFPSVKRLHFSCSLEDDLEGLTTYIERLPLLKDVVVLHHSTVTVSGVLAWMRSNSAYSGLTLKGYQINSEELVTWSAPPYPYERDERIVS